MSNYKKILIIFLLWVLLSELAYQLGFSHTIIYSFAIGVIFGLLIGIYKKKKYEVEK